MEKNKTLAAAQLCAFAAFLQKEEKSPATVEKYLREVQCFAAWLAAHGAEVNKEAVTAYKEELLNKGFCPATVNGKLTALDRLFGFLGWEGCKVKHLKVQRRLFREPGKELTREEYQPFLDLRIPVVLLDSSLPSQQTDCVVINNEEGAYTATNYLIRKRHSQPGYLRCRTRLYNFVQRERGYYRAIQENGFSVSECIIHDLPINCSVYRELKELLRSDCPIASCYFADNDFIALDAIRAFQEFGYRVPQDIAVVGFDNLAASARSTPPLTTVNVPKEYMGKLAAERMLTILSEKEFHPIKLEVCTQLVKRGSV